MRDALKDWHEVIVLGVQSINSEVGNQPKKMFNFE